MEKTKIGTVKDYILSEIKLGRIKIGQRLPSCREVSSALKVNKITVNKAYKELEAEHKVYSIPRGGFYLIDTLQAATSVPEITDFRTVALEQRLIPYREFTHVMNKAVEMYKYSLFNYETDGGFLPLRETLKGELEKDGVYTNPSNILITNGAQQAINLSLQYVCGKNKGKLLVEKPTYDLVLKLATHLGIEVTGIQRTKQGLDHKELELIFKTGEIKAFYIMPRHHNPTGYALTEKDKQKIAQLAEKYNVLIIEDDYLADLGSKKGSMPIHYYDTNKQTIHIRSFSKAFMPGIRMGAAILPESIMADMKGFKYITDLNTSNLPQAALELFIKSGMYQKHINKVKKSYEKKLKRAREIFNTLSPEGLKWHVPEQGIFIWVQLPNHIDPHLFEQNLKHNRILVKSAQDFFPQGTLEYNNKNHIRLCISGVTEKQIDSISIVLQALR